MSGFELMTSTVVGTIGVITFIAGVINWILKNGPPLLISLPIPPRRLILSGVGFGMLAGLLGGMPYIVEFQNPGVVPWPPTDAQWPGVIAWPPHALWLAEHDPQWQVKLVRVLGFSATIGMALSLLMTLAAMLGFHFSTRERSVGDTAATLLLLIALIAALAFVAIYVGSSMSTLGEAVAASKQYVGQKTFDATGMLQSWRDRPREGVFLGAGTCHDLLEFNTLPKDKTTGNTICDVGPIRETNIIVLVGIFVGFWAALLYLSVLGRTDHDDPSVRRHVFWRAVQWSICSVALSLLITAILEPWGLIPLAQERHRAVNSQLGLVLLASWVVLVCTFALVLIVRDIRRGLVARKTGTER
jgi:hypothetical protein